MFTNGLSVGSLEADDFDLSLSGEGATLKSEKPTSVSKEEGTNDYTLGLAIDGFPSVGQKLTVNPASNDAIFSENGTALKPEDWKEEQKTVTLNTSLVLASSEVATAQASSDLSNVAKINVPAQYANSFIHSVVLKLRNAQDSENECTIKVYSTDSVTFENDDYFKKSYLILKFLHNSINSNITYNNNEKKINNCYLIVENNKFIIKK